MLVPGPDARFGVVADIDDTILETGVQRVGQMIRQTFAGSALTRTPSRARRSCTGTSPPGANPVFYVSSSPWNLHAFLVGVPAPPGIPAGPVLLRDLLGTSAGREQKHDRIREILELHPGLPFILLGDSGRADPEIYADIVRDFPGGSSRCTSARCASTPATAGSRRSRSLVPRCPFVLAADSDAVRRHAAGLGLL